MRFSQQAIYRVPVAGWMVRDAIHGQPDAKYYFVANLIILVGALIYVVGYPLLICLALAAAALALTALVLLTASDALIRRPPGPARTDVRLVDASSEKAKRRIR